MTLAEIAPNLWEHTVPHSVAGIALGHRMTVLRLAGGDLILHSPTPPTPELRAELARLGPVRWLVAPSRMHDLWWPEIAAAFPEATCLGVPGLRESRPDVEFRPLLSPDAPPEWSDEVEVLLLQGAPRASEAVFIHKASRTLIVADLLFHLGPGQSFLGRLLLRLNGCLDKPAPSRLFRSLIDDPTRFTASLEALLTRDWDRIVVGHGATVPSAGKAVLQRAFGLTHRRVDEPALRPGGPRATPRP